MRKKVAIAAASMVLAVAVGFATVVPSAYAAKGKKVDCDQVMQELNSGKKAKEVAKDLGISVSSVRRCKKKAAKAEKGASKKEGGMAPAPAPAPGKP